MDDFIEAMVSHFQSEDVRQRFEVCSEFSIAEQWFRMEIFLWLRQTGWIVPLVEGPYCTKLPTTHFNKKSWKKRQKWCDLMAITKDGIYWFELKSIWYRRHTWKKNLNSALRDLLALAAMDQKRTAQIWEKPVDGARSYEKFLRYYAKNVSQGPHRRYLLCLMQAIPERLLSEDSKESISAISSKYLTYRSSQEIIRLGKDADLSQFPIPLEDNPDIAVEACRLAGNIRPRTYVLGEVDRGDRFPEGNPRGRLVLVIWKASPNPVRRDDANS